MNNNIKLLIKEFALEFTYNQENDVFGKDALNNNECDLKNFLNQCLKETSIKEFVKNKEYSIKELNSLIEYLKYEKEKKVKL